MLSHVRRSLFLYKPISVYFLIFPCFSLPVFSLSLLYALACFLYLRIQSRATTCRTLNLNERQGRILLKWRLRHFLVRKAFHSWALFLLSCNINVQVFFFFLCVCLKRPSLAHWSGWGGSRGWGEKVNLFFQSRTSIPAWSIFAN